MKVNHTSLGFGVAVIIPTYNAALSITKTITLVLKIIPEGEIYIVDDNSPDQTAEIVKHSFKNNRSIKVLSRDTKDGRGSAVIFGIMEACRERKNEFFIEMDADLCHDPTYIPQLVSTCINKDVVIASRYLPKSQIINWNMKRKYMSLLINNFAKALLGIPITDYTNGFRCYSRKAANIIINSPIKSKGYIVLSEIAYVCYKNGMEFAEVPITFYFEPITKSNLNLSEVTEALKTLIRLSIQK